MKLREEKISGFEWRLRQGESIILDKPAKINLVKLGQARAVLQIQWLTEEQAEIEKSKAQKDLG